MQTRYLGETEAPTFRKFALHASVRRCMKFAEGLGAYFREVAFCTKTRIYIFGFCSFPSICRLDWCKQKCKSLTFRKFAHRPSARLHERPGFMQAPYCDGQCKFAEPKQGLLYGFSIPVASFSYVDWIGANTVPRRRKPRPPQFALTVPYGAANYRVVYAAPYCEVSVQICGKSRSFLCSRGTVFAPIQSTYA